MGVLDSVFSNNKKVEKAKKTIRRVYLSDLRPWVIGYSGGKDSTTVLQLVIETLLEMNNEGIQLEKMVYVISSNTMVETPLIIRNINTNLEMVQEFAKTQGIPVQIQLVYPAIDNTFWVNIIGRGYPAPNQSFRWCTDRMKIEPSNKFILDKISEHGEVVVLLGVREGESNSRDRVIKDKTIEGKDLMKHSTLTNAYTFAPIRAFDINDVWEYLLSNKCPWDADNHELYKLYSDSNSNECPLIIDTKTKDENGSCGNGRFGCWVCTVVAKDKALTGFIENGETWLRPLLNYRNWLFEHRDDRSKRMQRRARGEIYMLKLSTNVVRGLEILVIGKKAGRGRVEIPLVSQEGVLTASNGEEYVLISENELRNYIAHNGIDVSNAEAPNLIIRKDDGSYNQLGLGPYTFEARFEMLEKLLKIQLELRSEGHFIELITDNELREIRRQWNRHGLLTDELPNIYEMVYGVDLVCEENDIVLINSNQHIILQELCDEENLSITPLIDLIKLEQKNDGNKFKKGIQDEISSILTKDYLHI